jgi:zinc transporter ZupT
MTATRTWLAVPALLLALTVTMLLWWRPLDRLAATAPPVEEAVVESVRLTPGLISLDLRSDGSEPVVVAQVQIDGAYRAFMASPGTLGSRLAVTRIEVPYPWIAGEAHHLALITRTGAVFEHTIEVAQETPRLNFQSSLLLGAVGVFLGLIPVLIGLLSWPAMRGISERGMRFLLALTIGLLAFLLLDTVQEGLEEAGKTIGRLRGPGLFWAVFAATALGLLAFGRRHGKPLEGLALALFIAIGIGLHNFGEGLAVGAALASGSAALATYLVIGFTIHNVTEGIGIAAPAAQERPTVARVLGLAAVAGLPAVAGTLLGTQAVKPIWLAICFAIAAGAILQVIVEIGALLWRRSSKGSALDPTLAAGIVTGLTAMYGTALFV